MTRISDLDAPTRAALVAGVRIAAAAPLKRSPWVSGARVPWNAVEDLRTALEAMGIDWRRAKLAGPQGPPGPRGGATI